MMNHSKDTQVEIKSRALRNKKILFLAAGSIGAIELPRLIREIRRYSADVLGCFLTENAQKFVTPLSVEWSLGKPSTQSLTGKAEHIVPHDTDALVIFPMTANFISKAALGICDDAVTTLFQSALSQKIPIILHPTMHQTLYSPIIQKNLASLLEFPNIFLIPGKKTEEKIKARDIKQLGMEISHIINKYHTFMKKDFTPPRALVTLGGTRVLIDSVRCLTNLSSGRLGQCLVKELYSEGITVDVFSGLTHQPTQELTYCRVFYLPDYGQFYEALQKISPTEYQALFHFAALSDFAVEKRDEKIPSGSIETLTLNPLPKCLDLESLSSIPFRGACKLTSNVSETSQNAAKKLLKKYKLDFCVWNNCKVFESRNAKYHFALIFFKDGHTVQKKNKPSIARHISNSYIGSIFSDKLFL